jgi:acetaldehyde dehydrogenase
MRNTVYVEVEDGVDEDQLAKSVMDMAERVRSYVPGYTITVPPFRRGDHFMVSVEVSGAGDYLPKYAGNLDIINAAAIAVVDQYASAHAN